MPVGTSTNSCGPRQSGRFPRDRHAEEDPSAGAIRDHRANASRERGQSIEDNIRKVTSAVATVLIPMIDELSGLEESDFGESGILGEGD
jgi:hypothetical protein